MPSSAWRSEEHTSELQSHSHLVCRLLLEKKNHRQLPAARPQSPLRGGTGRRSPRAARPRGRCAPPPGSPPCVRRVRLSPRFFFLKDPAPPKLSPFPQHAALRT